MQQTAANSSKQQQTKERKIKTSLTVVDVSNHRHVTDLFGLVHDGTELGDCEIHLHVEPRQHQQ